jgi:hypothetical protein
MTTPSDPGYPFRLDDINPAVRIPVLVVADNYGGSLLKSYLNNGTPVTARILGDAYPRIAEWNAPKQFGQVDTVAGFAVPVAGVYPLRLLAGHEGLPGGYSGQANLDWFSVKSDVTQVLLNDASDPQALKAFRARNAGPAPRLNPPATAANSVTIGWTGVGFLEQADLISGPWYLAQDQTNPQTVPASGQKKFYRVHQ